MTWISTTYALPDNDGIFEITNNPGDPHFTGKAEYDGYGFKAFNTYVEVNYWREITQPKEKRYGKIKPLISEASSSLDSEQSR